LQLWFKVDHTKYPSTRTKTLLELEDEVFLAAIDEGVLVSKGSWFIAERETFVPRELFLRATFAAASEENMTKAIERFGVAVRKIFGA
jgi:aromatic amino acid aminotransferase I